MIFKWALSKTGKDRRGSFHIESFGEALTELLFYQLREQSIHLKDMWAKTDQAETCFDTSTIWQRMLTARQWIWLSAILGCHDVWECIPYYSNICRKISPIWNPACLGSLLLWIFLYIEGGINFVQTKALTGLVLKSYSAPLIYRQWYSGWIIWRTTIYLHYHSINKEYSPLALHWARRAFQ